jgi:hypothetical protein
MDMKKILATLDGVASTPVTGSNDMKKFMNIIRESAVAKESVITSFEADSVGGDANTFLIDADKINDLVMSNIDKIKINADEQLLKDMMSKFNAFMSSYHAVGKDILQPGLFDDKMGVEIEEAGYRGRRDSYQRDYDSSVSGMGSRERENDEGNTEPPNNFAVSINGKPWKVFKGRGQYAEDDREKQHYQQLKAWAAKKSESTGKKWEVSVTGAPATENKAAEGNPFQVKPMAVSLDSWEKAVRARYPDAKFATQKTPNGATMAMNASGQVGIYDPKRSYSKVGPDVEEGNEFSGELAKAKASGAKSFNVDGKDYPVKEAGERTMSRAAKGHEKYGKEGMKALAKAGREGASDEQLDKIRDKHDKYGESLSFADYLNLAEAKQKGVDGKVCWDGYKRMGTKKKGGKTVDNCVPTGKK